MKKIILAILIMSGCTTGVENKGIDAANSSISLLSYHDEQYIDKYSWLRDKNYPSVNEPKILSFIAAENRVSNDFFQENKALLNTVFNEIKSRRPVKKSLPYEDQNYIYSSKYLDGAKYQTHYITDKQTRKVTVLLDERERSVNKDYYNLMSHQVSPDGQFMAWVEDSIGYEAGTIFIKDLKSNKVLSVNIKNASDEMAWAADSKTFYYVKKDEKGRDYQVESQSIYAPFNYEVIYTESDESFDVDLKQSLSKDKVFIFANNWIKNEIHVATKNDKNEINTQLIISRELNSLHDIDYIDGQYYLYTNYYHENFDLVKIPKDSKNPDKWEKIIERDTATYFKDIIFFLDFFAIPERKNGFDKIRIVDRKTGKQHYINFDDEIIGVTFHNIKQNKNGDTLRVRVASNLTPQTVYDYTPTTKSLDIVTQIIVKGYDKSKYTQERLLVPSNDGTKVPVTLIYNNKFGPNINNPVYMYVYGAYGEGIPPEFPVFALSAIDRGFTYAIAHVRGGDELGKKWHDQGKLLNRRNTFNDFLSISQHLVDIGYVAKGNISASGESSGGTTIGVAINEKPELYKSITALVPFVDVLNTLMDTSLEYTMSDWTEFGNPVENKNVFDYIKSYSPYDNIKRQNYPNIYVTGAIGDPAVGYWEPAKWVAKIRDNQTNESLTLLNFRNGGHIDTGSYTVELDFAKQISFLLITHNRTKL